MDVDPIGPELTEYKAALERGGMHPRAVYAYARSLEAFLRGDYGVLSFDEPGCRQAIEAYLGARGPSYDSFTVQAALRKWHGLRFGVIISKHRDMPGDFRGGDDINAEVAALRDRLAVDAITEESANAICNSAAMFLGWMFPDGPVDISSVDLFAVAEFLAQRKSHLSVGGMKTEATRLKRYVRFVGERTGADGAAFPLNPPSWGNAPLPRGLSDAEYDALTAYDGSGRSAAVSAAAALMGNLGLRCCEAAGLEISDIDFRGGSVLVRATKGEEDRRLPLDEETGSALARYIVDARPRSESGRLFIRAKSHRGEPMTKSQLRGLMRYQARLAGIPDFGTHMLRRRTASKMVQSGVPIKVVADVLGHQDVQTTKGYLRIDAGRLRLAAGDWPGAANG